MYAKARALLFSLRTNVSSRERKKRARKKSRVVISPSCLICASEDENCEMCTIDVGKPNESNRTRARSARQSKKTGGEEKNGG